MRKTIKLWIILSLLFVLVGCGSDRTPELTSGFYEAQYELQFYKTELTFTPWIRIDTSDNSFLFMYGSDPRPAGSPWGYYVVEGDVLTATTNQFDIVFQFRIIDETTLQLTGTNKTLGDELFAVLSDTAQLGDIFVWSDPLPEK